MKPGFCIQDEITKEEVEEWMLGTAAVGMDWLFRCHGCNWPELANKYFQLFSVHIKDEDEEYIMDLCKRYFL